MNPKKEKVRLDRMLVDRGLAESREKAQAVIAAGQVLVNGQRQDKAGTSVRADAEIRITGEALPYVSRGGLKLEAALREFRISVEGRTALDIGASTGGFTDCLLQHGCAKVYAVDVGYGQMAWKLRQDPRVVVIERTNVRELSPSLVPGRVDIAVIDVSFISLEKVVPPVQKFLKRESELVALIKPQFEAGKGRVGKGGVVRDPALHRSILNGIAAFCTSQGWRIAGLTA